MRINQAKTLAGKRHIAKLMLDELAAVARSRRISVSPGQESVYAAKAAQARAYQQRNFNGAVPPYIAAEANATGLTPREAAELIISAATSWDESAGPAIEGTRRRFSIRIQQAEQVQGRDFDDVLGDILSEAEAALLGPGTNTA